MDASQPADTRRVMFEIEAIHGRVSADEVLDDPMLSWVLVESASWSFVRADWQSHQPRRYRFRRARRWAAEGAALARDREHIEHAARRLGVLR